MLQGCRELPVQDGSLFAMKRTRDLLEAIDRSIGCVIFLLFVLCMQSCVGCNRSEVHANDKLKGEVRL
jgi:hypothetical protein